MVCNERFIMKRSMRITSVVAVLFLCFGLRANSKELQKIDNRLRSDLINQRERYFKEGYETIFTGLQFFARNKEATINAVNDVGRSRLHYAVILDDLELVKMIIKHAHPDILDKQDNDGKTALYYAAELLGRLENGFSMLTALLKAGANPNLQNYKANTPLLIGVKNALNDKQALHLVYIFLIDAQTIKPDFSLENEQQENVLKLAKKRKFIKTVKALEEAGAK